MTRELHTTTQRHLRRRAPRGVVTPMRATVDGEDATASSSSATARAAAFGARTRVCYGVLTFDDRRESQRKVPVRFVLRARARGNATDLSSSSRVDVLWGVVSKRAGAAARAPHAAHRGCVGEVQVYVRGRGSTRGSVL